MPDITPNLNLNRPFGGEAVATWHTLVNPNWDILDAIFSGVPSTAPGGTGHMHNGLAGQGPQISHTHLLNIGTKTHDQLETDLSTIDARITHIEGDYCADSTCGAGQGGGGSDIHPPLHYTDNFNTAQGTSLAQNDWLVQSASGAADFQTSGRSAYLTTLMGLQCVDRYAAVVKCQIPHSTAQRITYHISRFTANGLEDADGIMMVMALMSTHLLGAVTPFIQSCGIKFVLSLTRAGGLYNVTRTIVVEPTDGIFTILKQDVFVGLTFGDAELHFRGCHEFSTDENGGVWYYHNRAPVYILPQGAVASFYAPLQLTLLGLGEPAFGSIGFGWAWDLDPQASFDVEMEWLTIDSKANVESPYTTSYLDPGNTPVPFDPTPGDFCCGGGGPQIGAQVDLGDGLFLEAVACVTDPFQGVLLSNGEIMPCGDYEAPTGGDPGPATVTEGDTFTREIPIVNMTPPANTEYVIVDEEVFDYVFVELNRMGATITGRVKDGAFGSSDPTIIFTQKTDLGNTYGPVTICLLEAGALAIDSIDVFDPWGVPVIGLPERDYFWVKVTTTGYADPGPFPKALGPDLAIVGDVDLVDQKYLRASNEMWARVLTKDLQPPYLPAQKIDVTVTRGIQVATDAKQVDEAYPIINGIGITATSPPGGPPFPLNPGDTITLDIYGWHFDVGAVISVPAPHTLVAPPAFTDENQLTGAQILIGGLLGDPILIDVINPSGGASGPQVVAVVADTTPFVGPAATVTILGTPVDPFEGQWAHVVITSLPLRPQIPLYHLEAYVGISPIPWENFRNKEAYDDRMEFDVLIPLGLSGAPITFGISRYQATLSSAAVTGNILPEPIPVGTPTPSPLYPGATGSTFISGVGEVFWPDLRVFGNPTDAVIITNVTISTPFNKILVEYEIAESVVPGTPLSLDIENLWGAAGAVFLGNATRPPVVIDEIEYSVCEVVEGRVNVPFTVKGENFDPLAAIAIIAGPGTVHDVVWVSDTEMTFLADFPISSGGVPFTVQVSNPAPDPSSDTDVINLSVEPVPRVGLVLLPNTPGVGRTIQLVGFNIYCIDDVCPSDSNFSFTNLANIVWSRKTNLMWEGTCDITGIAGQTVVGDVSTPGGQSYAGIAQALIREVSLTPAPTAFTPGDVETATATSYRIDGIDFDSVAVVEAMTAGLVPIGEAQSVPMQITALSPDWVVGNITLPDGVADLVYDVKFYDVTLGLIGTMPAAFTAVKGALSPYITNKAVVFSTTPGASVTATFTLDPATPILNPAAWSVSNGTLISAVDVSAGAGTAWQLQWTNGVAGDFEIRVIAPVLPLTFDVVRRILS